MDLIYFLYANEYRSKALYNNATIYVYGLKVVVTDWKLKW